MVFAPLEPATRERFHNHEKSPIFSYSGGLEHLYNYFKSEVYQIQTAPPTEKPSQGRRRGGKGLSIPCHFVEINGAIVKLVAAVIIACKLQEEASEYYILLCYAQQHLPDVLYDVVSLISNGCELCPFGVGRGPVYKGKPSPTRFDDWLMAYEAHLTNHLEDLHLSNDFENFNDVFFGKFHVDEFLSGQRSLKTKSAANVGAHCG